MKMNTILSALLICAPLLTFGCKENTITVQSPTSIVQIAYINSHGFSQNGPEKLTIYSDSIKFSWGKSSAGGMYVGKNVAFVDSTILTLLKGTINIQEFWNLSDTYGSDATIADMSSKSISIVADELQSKKVFVWENGVIPQEFGKISYILDSLIDSYKIKFPIP